MIMRDEFLWVEKYRPKTIEECILPTSIKETFQNFLDKGEVPNLLLAGPAGCGKTTVAKALCNELGVDYYVINGSDEGRFLDTVRNTAKNFASTVSLQATGRPKVIIIDETSITQQTTYNSYLGRFVRSFMGTAGSSSPATTKTKSSTPSIPVVPSLNFPSEEKNDKNSPPNSSSGYKPSWIRRVLDMSRKFLSNSSTNTSLIGDVSSMNVKGTRQEDKSTPVSLPIFPT